MLPRVILHNSVSLDGSLVGFDVDMALHYKIAGDYGPDVHLIGSNTAKTGMTMYGDVPQEEESDMTRPGEREGLPYWAIPDTRGSLLGVLHVCRRFEFCRDVVVLVSERTPADYIRYLEERDYDHHLLGEDRVDLVRSLELLSNVYGAGTILADTGRILGNILLERGLVSEISLLIHPVIVGKESYNMFGNVKSSLGLALKKSEFFDNGCIWSTYEVRG
jgi:2,5-diamino-6-(ribosylamino)-4(3H)-pyrimidinone 5'-phosphate reductase